MAGLVTEFGDGFFDFVYGEAEAGAGGADDVFLHHHAAVIVGAVLERDLADLGALRDPARLDVVEIVEEDAAERPAMRRYSCEPVGGMLRILVPSLWKVQQMNAVKPPVSSCTSRGGAGARCGRRRFRRGRTSWWRLLLRPSRVGDAHDFEPVIGIALERRDAVAHGIDENFAAAAGDAAESRFLKRVMTSSSDMPKTSAKWLNSGGEKPWMLMVG